MKTAAHSHSSSPASFHQAAWDRYSPTTPAPGRVPDATLDQAMSEFRTGSKELAYDILKSHPNADSDANALNALGVMETFLEDYGAASESLGRAVELLDERKAIALANLATVRIYQRNWPDAEDLAVQATKVSPSTPHGWVNLLFILARTEQYEKLEASFERMDADFADWQTCDEILTRLRKDTLPALRKAPSIRHRIELRLPS